MSTWTLIVVFSWMSQPFVVAHSGFSVPGFANKKACQDAGELIASDGKWACLQTVSP
jgi:hypothetical protein